MKSPSYNFYPNNWLASARIAAMLPEQEGAYIRLLCFQWNSEDQTLPDDDILLAAMSRLGPRWETMGAAVKACFHPHGPGKLRNERLWHEYQRIEKMRARQAAGGREAMRKRHASDSKDAPKLLAGDLVATCSREQRTGNREQREENRAGNTPPTPPRGKARENQRVAENTPLMDRIGAWFSRRPSTRWTLAEAAALRVADPVPEDVDLLEWFYGQRGKEGVWLRQNVVTLLNNWQGEVDKANAWKAKHEKSAHRGISEQIPIKRIVVE